MIQYCSMDVMSWTLTVDMEKRIEAFENKCYTRGWSAYHTKLNSKRSTLTLINTWATWRLPTPLIPFRGPICNYFILSMYFDYGALTNLLHYITKNTKRTNMYGNRSSATLILNRQASWITMIRPCLPSRYVVKSILQGTVDGSRCRGRPRKSRRH